MAPLAGTTTVQVAAAMAVLVAAFMTSCSEVSGIVHNDTFACDLKNSSSCDVGECCVKKVSWRLEDSGADVEVSTECQALLTADELCLLHPQGYLCDCGPGLVCKTKQGEDFGHCTKA